jgi:excisionase family DNA binding protein
MTPTPTAEHLVSVTQAAGMLGCTQQTVRKWIREGKLSALKMPGATAPYLLVRSEVEAHALQYNAEHHKAPQ